MSSVLGPGILVLPGITARVAGPAALVAWLGLGIASLPFAFTFSALSARRPAAGGVYAFAREAFGAGVARATGWLFALWMVTGAPAVALVAASYLGYAFPLSRPETFGIAYGIVLVAALVNYSGIRFSSRVQLAVVVSIVVLLVSAIALALTQVRPAEFRPFAPFGLVPIGTAAALAFWSFLGYENVSNVADDFVDPARDFRRSVGWSVGIIGTLYFAVALVIVGTGAYRVGSGVAPFAVIFGNVLGPFAAAGTAVLAVAIVFAVVNAYTAGMARVAYATALDGGFPRSMATRDASTGVPTVALGALLAGASGVFVGYYLLDVDLTLALLIPSGAAILVYVLGSASGVRIFLREGIRRRGAVALASITLATSLVVLPFVGVPLIAAAAAVAGSLVFARSR